MSDIIVKGYKCDRCGYQWASHGDKRPKRCAKCRTPYWDEPRKQEQQQRPDYRNLVLTTPPPNIFLGKTK